MTKMILHRVPISALASVATVILMTVSVARAQDKKLAPINISYASTSGLRVPLWIAKEMRLYEKYGLDAILFS